MRQEDPGDGRALERVRLLSVIIVTTAVIGGWLAWNAQVWFHALFSSLR
jgi:hypothetical protein